MREVPDHPETAIERATISDVARRAGVSRQTVSNAVHNPQRLNVETLERVQRAIEDLGYRPQAAAQSLRHQRTGAIGFEIGSRGPRRANETLSPILSSLAMAAAENECHIVPFGSNTPTPMIDGYRAMWRSQLVDAFIIADTHHHDPRPEWLARHGLPFAAFGRVWDDPTFTRWVDVDGALGTAEAVHHLAGAGYHTVAFLGWPEGSVTGDDRRRGWARGCDDAGVLRGPEGTSRQVLDDAMRAARLLVTSLDPGSAVLCASDLLALAVHHVAVEERRRIGPDLGIVGFDGSFLAEMHHLSTVEQPFALIADKLLHLVRDALNGEPPPTEGRLVAPSIIDRSSSLRLL
ncbi:MAG: LacI family DNA-binding transcriptional regulator [Dermatophilaceae bacterium]